MEAREMSFIGHGERLMDRRTFYISSIYGLWALIGAVLATPALIYLLLPPKARQQDPWTEAGDVSRLEPNVPVEMVFRRNRMDGWRLMSEKSTTWVVKLDEGIVAYGPQCTHLGCAYHWNEKMREFLCPCHTSTFGTDGRVTSGPAPRPLDRFTTKIENNKLFVGRLEKSEEAPS
jgi:menaquinol-cytochrome c reductase iron-sulfur subunit